MWMKKISGDGDMELNEEMLKEYARLMKNTDMQKGYQEFIRLFRYVHTELKRMMPEYTFTQNIAENRMDFAYFQASDAELKDRGLKLQVVFIHAECRFEVWLSGYNRQVQKRMRDIFVNAGCPYELCTDPARNEYILHIPVSGDIPFWSADEVIREAAAHMREIRAYVLMTVPQKGAE